MEDTNTPGVEDNTQPAQEGQAPEGQQAQTPEVPEQQPTSFADEVGGQETQQKQQGQPREYTPQQTNDFEAGKRIGARDAQARIQELEAQVAQQQPQQVQQRTQVNDTYQPSGVDVNALAGTVADMQYANQRDVKIQEHLASNPQLEPLKAHVTALSRQTAYKNLPTQDLFHIVEKQQNFSLQANNQPQEQPVASAVPNNSVAGADNTQNMTATERVAQMRAEYRKNNPNG